MSQTFNHIPNGAYYCSTKGYSGLSSVAKFHGATQSIADIVKIKGTKRL